MKNTKVASTKSDRRRVDTGRIWSGDEFSGTAVFYAATKNDHFPYMCDYRLETLSESHPSHSRGRRQQMLKAGIKPPQLPKNSLQNEVIVLIGPDLSLWEVVTTLERLLNQLKNDGMMVGWEPNGNILWENPKKGPK